MVGLWNQILLGKALSDASRARLIGWLEACQTGPDRLPKATPPEQHWRIGHKTGSGATTLGDVAILTPGDGHPVLIAVYLEAQDALSGRLDSAIAEAGRIALGQLRNKT